MGTILHKIEYFSAGEQIASTVWCGPVEGIIEIAKSTMVKKGADAARVVVEQSDTEVWSGTPNA
jgi:hypothetical protein